MLQIKRGTDDGLIENLRESSKKNRTCIGREETLDLSILGDLHRDSTLEEQIESDSGQSIWSELSEQVTSEFSTNVVCLALCAGHDVLFACSGIAVHCQVHFARFLTSASLVRAFNDLKREGHDGLKIQVQRKGYVARGSLGDYNFDQGIALVSIKLFTLGVNPVKLYHQLGFLPCSKVVSVACATTGKLTVTSGILTDDTSGSENGKELMFSTCKISKDWEGGALFDYDGNFVGMNLSSVEERTSFLPTSIIIKHLEQFVPNMEVKVVRPVTLRRYEEIQPRPYMHYPRDIYGDLDSLGYPKQSTTTISEGLILVNTFEETFGEVYDSGKGVWSRLRKTISNHFHQVVVSLASFIGETRIFACTGLFIDWNGCTTILTSASLIRDPNDGNKIAENLKIEVNIPNEGCKKGILQHCNLHYNVALVDVEKFRPLCSSKILEEKWDPRILEDPNVVAVGRCFKSGVLMATHGKRTDWSGMLDCRDLRYSSCTITKAGIGGPLFDFRGRFVGMNFYDKKIGTPFVFKDHICRLLAQFEGKSTVDEVGSVDKPIRWPVPKPCWRHPDDELDDLRPPGHGEKSDRFGFTYVRGVRVDYH
ncbi:unnamed protein product [Triticum turgidum subsp. durum]|uniref:Uncharacterized protein n=1 Tax=Triticum turgidum subsp. durum TaxID=4567 RepID=A0A9R1ANI4_TRITD|nr:unnamed protein product [Triticum turgidum subsp. durum]